MASLIQQTVEEDIPLLINLKNNELQKKIWRKEDKNLRLTLLKI